MGHFAGLIPEVSGAPENNEIQQLNFPLRGLKFRLVNFKIRSRLRETNERILNADGLILCLSPLAF